MTVTAARLAEQCAALPAGPVLVHCSMRSIGFIDGGAASLLGALRPGRTVVVPAQTVYFSTTSPDYRVRSHGFDPAVSPSQGMGALAEEVRRAPDAVRSRHPLVSFAAVGPAAVDLMATHDDGSHLGDRSPLAALYAARASVALIGVGFASCTAFHLAEYRLPWSPRIRRYRCAIQESDGPRDHTFTGLSLDDSDFPAIGAAMADAPYVTTLAIGQAHTVVFPICDAVDFAIGWMVEHRRPPDRLVSS